jgi:serine/threonine protein kinase
MRSDRVKFPGPISETFKSFLELMLNKDQNERARSSDLFMHPFIHNVDLSQFQSEENLCRMRYYRNISIK